MPWYKKCEVKPETDTDRVRRENKEAQSRLGATLDELEQLLRKAKNGVSPRTSDKQHG